MAVRKTIDDENDSDVATNLEAVGNALLSLPLDTTELLFPLLSDLENCLTGLDQSPPKCLQTSINLAMNSLTSKQLLHNEDANVKVSVALCVTEILRITAPVPACDDERMKDLLALIVSEFDNLADISSSYYPKRVSILEHFARVRLWIIMLDLNCDSLIIQMFKNFLANIREDHHDDVFMYMGMTMIRVLEEMDEIPLELLSTLLGYLRKKRNKFNLQKVLPIGRKLGERVIENSYKQLIPYMNRAVRYTGCSVKDYGKIVQFLCQQQDLIPERNNDEAVAAQDNSPGDCLALENKDGSSVPQWTGKKRRLSSKISNRDMNEQLSAETSLPQSEDEHFVGDVSGSSKGVECSAKQKSCKSDVTTCEPLKKQKVQEPKSIESEDKRKGSCIKILFG
ncbi:hypothetical protein M5689_006789 [Euphorbia peplus]|nr:hypothetical protein M5689_006789 [Euphorbia peplus]